LIFKRVQIASTKRLAVIWHHVFNIILSVSLDCPFLIGFPYCVAMYYLVSVVAVVLPMWKSRQARH